MRILIAGATSALGRAVAEALQQQHVIAVGSNASRLESVPAAERRVCDLTNAVAVGQLAAEVGELDALVHLVGGWRGGGGLAGQSDEDWAWLEPRIVGTLRQTTKAFAPAIGRAKSGAIVAISTTGLERPTAGNANYVSLKAAAETWLGAVSHELRETPARVIIKRVKSLVSAEQRAAEPERAFPGATDVTDLAAEIAADL